MPHFLTITSEVSTLKLVDVCPRFKAALDRFSDNPTSENWEDCLAAAQEFRAKVKLLDGERV